MATYTHLAEEKQEQQAAQQSTAAPALQTMQQKSSSVYNPANDAAYQNAMSALETAKQQMPSYQNSYEAQLKDLYNQITGRDAFSYNMNEDALYQQYKQQYQNQGQLAMRDTMGQAAALTGGYGSSYGQSVGQQQYNAYLQNLNDVVPELYGMAYQQYQDQGNALQQQYSMMGQLADDEYGKYQDALTQYWQNLNYLQNEANTFYNRGMQEAELAYERQQTAYANLVDMITQLGYSPSADELEAAGMSDAQFQSYMNYYNLMNPAPVASSGGSERTNGGGKTLLEQAKEALDAGENIDDISAAIKSLAGSDSEYSKVGVQLTNYALNNNKMNTNSAQAADSERYEIMNLKNKK